MRYVSVATLLQGGVALSAIDAGFRWPKRMKAEGERDAQGFTRGGMYSLGYAVAMNRQSHRDREGWQPRLHAERRLHLTPTGIYYEFIRNSGERFYAGSFLRPDGTVGHFEGTHYTPLYCLGCGRADFRANKEYTCNESFEVPRKLLKLLPSDPQRAASRRKEWAEHRKRLRAEERRKAELAAATKAARDAEAATRTAALRAHREAQEAQQAREAARGPVERAARSAVKQVKEIALWLLFFILLGIASRGI